MSESAGEIEPKSEPSPRKRVRHRKKLIYDKILKQMEFYFSDANLSKDRFLGGLIKSDPFVPIETFLKFNKIRAMTQCITDIAKAMKYSSILEISEDKTKVRRKTAMLPYDAESRTVYVESIPVTASREWLEGVFSDYGPVAYISLPKFRNTEKIKGYAFVEYVKTEDAQKCLHAFTKMGCKLPTSMPPEELSTIKLFCIEEVPENVIKGGQKTVEDTYEPPKKKIKKGKEKKLQKNLELKFEDQESGAEDKSGTPLEEDAKSTVTPTEEPRPAELSAKEEMSGQEESGNTEEGRKKKTRKSSGKDRSKVKKSPGKNEAPKGALWGLQVLSKCEWKTLRNKYLNLQRKNMKELKNNLRNNGHSRSHMPAPPLKMESEMPQSGVTERAKQTEAPLQRQSGVFVRDELSEPCLDVRQQKRQVRVNVNVQHVDVKEGQTEMIIRFDSAEAATEYCSKCKSARVLGGAEESQQWERAEAARGAGKKMRGRVRLVKRADAASGPTSGAPADPQPTTTHIRFDDDSNT